MVGPGREPDDVGAGRFVLRHWIVAALVVLLAGGLTVGLIFGLGGSTTPTPTTTTTVPGATTTVPGATTTVPGATTTTVPGATTTTVAPGSSTTTTAAPGSSTTTTAAGGTTIPSSTTTSIDVGG